MRIAKGSDPKKASMCSLEVHADVTKIAVDSACLLITHSFESYNNNPRVHY